MAIGQKYHISLNSEGRWQVKGEKAEKALKLFDTQKEAIAYAKSVAGNQEGNFVIHKTDGKIRKQVYKSTTEKKEPEKKAPAKAAAKPAEKKVPAKTAEKKAPAKAPAKPVAKKK